jgi:DNA-3-methyladenine glycosylase II
MTPEAQAHLSKVCPIMRKLIRTHGPCGLVPKSKRTPFQSLVRAVAHQQLHGVAAETILRRFQDLFGGRFPTAARVAEVTDDQLRGVGFSRAKVAAIRDIAAKTLDGTVPGSKQIKALDDEAIIERLTSVRGVGRWTVEMYLIFTLGRTDVFPADDFGVRNGYRIIRSLPELPKPKEILAYAERWRPHGTTAAWYLWRAADTFKPGG